MANQSSINAGVHNITGTDFQKHCALFVLLENYPTIKDPKLRADYCDSYLRLMTDLGIDTIIFPYVKVLLSHLHYPIYFSDALRSESYLNIKIPAGYMRDIYDDTDDWQSIVVRGLDGNDNLLRAESNPEPWKIWMEEYSFYHYR